MAGRPWVLREAALHDTRGLSYEVAVLPWGATEPHNLHLPFGTDSIQAESVAEEAARRAWEAGARVVVLPTVPFGANAQQLGTALTIDLSPSTQAAVLADVVRSLEGHGVRKLMVLNGHGGNDFRQMIRELQARTDLFLCASNWYTAVNPAPYFDEPGDHAGELETSVMMYRAPELVLPLDTAGPGAGRVFRLSGLRSGVAWAPRDWARVTEDTGVGNPRAATSEKGAAYFEAVTRVLGDFLVELAGADPADMYDDAEGTPAGG